MTSKCIIINSGIIFFLLLFGLVHAAGIDNSTSDKDPEITHIEIAGPELVIRGNSANYTCTAYFDDGTNLDVTNLTAWSDECEYGDIDSNGQLVTTEAPGTTDPSAYFCSITGSYQNRIRTFEITLKDLPVLSVLQDFRDVPETGGTTTFDIENAGAAKMKWAVFENTDWFDIKPGSGTNSGIVTVSFQSNCGKARTGTITIVAPGASDSPKTVEVRQAPGYHLSVTPAYRDIPETRGTTYFDIANMCEGAMEWFVSEDSDWFSVTPDSGTNNGTVTVSYDINSGNERTGSITITAPGAVSSPRTVELRQASVTWTEMTSSTSYDLQAIWGSSLNNVFAVGKEGVILHYDGNAGNTWTKMQGPAFSPLHGIWGSSETNIYVVGTGGVILRYDGNAWTHMISSTYKELRAVWGSSGTSVFAAGEQGIILHYDGNEDNTWKKIPSPTLNTLYGLWGSSENDVFAVGGDWHSFTVLRYDGNESLTWKEMLADSFYTSYGVWGSSENNVFAVGNSGMIFHYDTDGWKKMESGSSEYFRGVWGTSDLVFAAGTNGVILNYTQDTEEWSEMATATSKDLNGIWGNSENDVFAVGSSGVIIRFSEKYVSGDADGNRVADLADALLILKVLAGINPGPVSSGADINNDQKIGMEEAAYILQKISGLK